jgi:RNA polymerase sigma factor (sigma-70 family)
LERSEQGYGHGEEVPVVTADTRSHGGKLDSSELERDRLLVARCQEGDAGAFATLYELHYPRLVRFCRRRVASRHLAEDAAQDSFVRAWRAIDTLEPGSSFYPWLTVIAAHRCTDLVRKERRARPVADVPPPRDPVSADVVDHLVRREDAATAGVAVRRLSPRHQRVLLLREELGLSVAEIAALEGATPNATDTLLWRARSALQREFRALVDGAAGLAVLCGVRFAHFGRRVLHPLARTADAAGAHGPAPWAPLAFAASLTVAGGVLVAHVAAPSAGAGAGGTAGGSTQVAGTHGAASSSVGHQPGGGAAPSASTPGSGATIGTAAGTQGASGSGSPSTATGGSGGSGGVNPTSSVGGAVSGAGGAVGGAVNGAGSLANSAGTTVGGAVSGVGNAATSAVGGVTNTLGSATGGLTSPVTGSGSSSGASGSGSGLLPPAGSSPTSGLGSAAGSATNSVGGTLQQTGLGSGLPKIP